MNTFFRLIRGDFQKTRGTSILWIHIIVPILIGVLVDWYYSSSSIDNISKVGGYMEVLAIGFPTIIGVVCAIVAEQEALAGNFQELLMSKNKLLSFFSKLCMMLLMALGSLIIAVGILVLGLEFLIHKTPFPVTYYGKIILILLFCEIFIYILHLLCSFRFGSGASIGFGIAESLIACLMLTGLGDKVWKYTPCSWGLRISSYYTQINIDKMNSLLYMKNFESGIYICLIMTVLLFLISFLWFNHFEGREES